mmetsp:Transcript_71813/g.142492  ORF Transcript_71813/g.142492 Transcript_71813/m.142492 type:complete len:216 (+) Transcript_71813:397-1044(+)
MIRSSICGHKDDAEAPLATTKMQLLCCKPHSDNNGSPASCLLPRKSNWSLGGKPVKSDTCAFSHESLWSCVTCISNLRPSDMQIATDLALQQGVVFASVASNGFCESRKIMGGMAPSSLRLTSPSSGSSRSPNSKCCSPAGTCSISASSSRSHPKVLAGDPPEILISEPCHTTKTTLFKLSVPRTSNNSVVGASSPHSPSVAHGYRNSAPLHHSE